jgi:hypothetical protein
VVISAEALFSLTDLHGLDPEAAIASIVHTATTLTRASLPTAQHPDHSRVEQLRN